MVQGLNVQSPHPQWPGCPPELSIENQALVALEYWCEYRIYFHIATDWMVSEPTIYRAAQGDAGSYRSGGELSKAMKIKAIYGDHMMPQRREKSPLEGWRIATEWVCKLCDRLQSSCNFVYTVGLCRDDSKMFDRMRKFEGFDDLPDCQCVNALAI